MILAVDIETCSAAKITNGAAPYAEHPSTRVHVVVFGGSDRRGHCTLFRWFPGQGALPRWIVEHIAYGRPVLAHNATFEASIFEHILVPHHGFPAVSSTQWEDSLAIAASLNLPLGLGNLGEAIGAQTLKDDEGHDLMLKLSAAKRKGSSYVYPTVTPQQLERLAVYCERDVLCTVDCYWRLPSIPAEEHRMIRVDRRINERGVKLDLKLAHAMQVMAKKREQEIAVAAHVETQDLLGVSSVPALTAWLKEQGVALPMVRRKKADGTFHMTESVDRTSMVELLAGDVPPTVRTVLQLRQEAGRATSIAKTARVPEVVNRDGRLRHSLRYSKAHTGRWTSEAMQLHNLARPPKEFKAVAAPFAAAVLAGDIATARSLFPVLEGLSYLLRSLVVADTGHVLLGGDFASIEARIVAWLAGQADKLDVFRAYDAGRWLPEDERKKLDPYVVAAAKLNTTNRQLGKIAELGLGFGMGPLKFRDTAAKNGIVLTPKESFAVVRDWRKANAMISSLWAEIESACVHAMENPGLPVFIRDHLTAIANKECLKLVLPSGRAIHYWRPHRRPVVKRIETITEDGELEVREFETVELRYFTPAGAQGMVVEATYSGKLTENVVQAVARDLLRDALLRLEADGFPVVLHVHDSIAAEVKAAGSEQSLDRFCRLMAETEPWAEGLPVAVEGYRSGHFKG